MPNKKGPNTYKGYESPNTHGWPEPIQKEVRHVYGAWREKNPGEDPKLKSRGSRIAWSAAKRKYPELYNQHIRDERRLKIGAKIEKKEHPWASKKTAERIAGDHVSKDPNAYVPSKKPSKSNKGQKKQVRDLKETSPKKCQYVKKADNSEIQAARIAAIKG
jgi:hypothetical protein